MYIKEDKESEGKDKEIMSRYDHMIWSYDMIISHDHII